MVLGPVNEFKGIPASRGFAIGKLLKLSVELPVPSPRMIEAGEEPDELVRLIGALDAARGQLNKLIVAQTSDEKAAIFRAHLSLLEDPALDEAIQKNIMVGLHNVEMAVDIACREVAATFEALESDYLKERAADVRDVHERLHSILTGVRLADLSALDEEVVVVARDLSPSQTASMDTRSVLGFATELGGRTSHTSIMAQSMNLPAVVGCAGLFNAALDGQVVIVDGISGSVLLYPDSDQLAHYIERRDAFAAEQARLLTLASLPAVTVDGHSVELAGNAGSYADVKAVKAMGVDGIGLFRTEFLYMERDQFPTEDEQLAVYAAAAKALDGKSLIIRTLDIGGDKALPYFLFDPELNPFLGHRAIRFCLDRTDIFKTQLRAILRASMSGKVRIMYPMITSIEELFACGRLLDTCKQELEAEHIAYSPQIEVGIMVETPSAVILAEAFARHVDFFSIGTNDLTQYLLAVDRGNEKIQALYNPFHPAVLRSIKHVIDASHKSGKWCGICGEFAGDPDAIPILLGMGLDEFSVSRSALLDCKERIRNSNYADCFSFANQVLELETSDDIARAIRAKTGGGT